MDAALATLRGGCGSPAAEAAVLQALALLLQQASTSHTTLPAAVTQAVAQVCLQNTDAPRLVRVLGYDLLLCTGFANTAAWTALSRAAIFDVSADVGYGTYQHTPLHMVMVACMCAVSVKLSQLGCGVGFCSRFGLDQMMFCWRLCGRWPRCQQNTCWASFAHLKLNASLLLCSSQSALWLCALQQHATWGRCGPPLHHMRKGRS